MEHGGQIDLIATQNWTGSGRGNAIEFKTIEDDSLSQVTSLYLKGNKAMVGDKLSFSDYFYTTFLVAPPENLGGICILANSTSDVNYLLFADGTGSAAYRGYINYEHNNDKLNFAAGAVVGMTLDGNKKLGISTTSPTQELDVNGCVSIQGDTTIFGSTSPDTAVHNNNKITGTDTLQRPAFQFSTAKTYYYSMNAIQFIPIDDNGLIDDVNATMGIDSLTVINEADVIFKAEVNLPHGATVTNVIVKGNDATETWELKRQTGSTGATSQMATANINSNDNTITNAIIDNSTYTYGIETSAMEGLAGDALYSGFITYTITEL